MCVMAGFHRNDYSVDSTSGSIMCSSGFLSTYYSLQYIYKRKRDPPSPKDKRETLKKNKIVEILERRHSLLSTVAAVISFAG